jgi:hypothetical protein
MEAEPPDMRYQAEPGNEYNHLGLLYHRVSESANPDFPKETTHSRIGDWEVSRVEEYAPTIPGSDYDIVVICYCKLAPIESVLEPLLQGQVTADSFGGNEEEYQEYLKRTATQVEVR